MFVAGSAEPLMSRQKTYEEVGIRKSIAGMKVSVDGELEGPEGTAAWVKAWSDDYGLTPQIDACVLGAGMYPGYERYWTAIRNEPDKPVWISGSAPTPAEIEWGRNRCPQAAARQRHLSRWGCSNYGELYRCRAGG